jgi:hypothetical protein
MYHMMLANHSNNNDIRYFLLLQNTKYNVQFPPKVEPERSIGNHYYEYKAFR